MKTAFLTTVYEKIHRQVTSPYTKLVFLAALFFICTQQEISFRVAIGSGEFFSSPGKEVMAVQDISTTPPAEPAAALTAAPAKRNWTKRQLVQLEYVRRYADVAAEEQRKHQIPVSITLAQGLLESGHGTSTLARRNNNHFGIKCFSKKCRKGHCSNHSDDHHKDFFRIFKDARESYAAHSEILMKPRYKRLFTYSASDYKAWSRGLSKAGYATDPRYADKLIRMIEDLELWRYDRQAV